jgi:hypothetical protein
VIPVTNTLTFSDLLGLQESSIGKTLGSQESDRGSPAAQSRSNVSRGSGSTGTAAESQRWTEPSAPTANRELPKQASHDGGSVLDRSRFLAYKRGYKSGNNHA